jgi:hypothetical protein
MYHAWRLHAEQLVARIVVGEVKCSKCWVNDWLGVSVGIQFGRRFGLKHMPKDVAAAQHFADNNE